MAVSRWWWLTEQDRGAAITDVLDLTGGTGNVGLGSGNLGTALTTGTDNVAIGEASCGYWMDAASNMLHWFRQHRSRG